MRRYGALAVAVLALGLGACGSTSPGHTALRDASSTTGSDRLATNAAYAFLNAYTVDGGRIRRTDQGGDTVGEGQAYGMLAAAAVGDQARFGRIWGWTKAHMLEPNGLLAFHWAGGRVVDPQPASDADLDAARALLVAGCRFHRSDLRAAALAIGRSVLSHETAQSAAGMVLLAGPWANHGGRLVINPSYLDPVTLNALALASGDGRYKRLARDGERLINGLARPLPPDWAAVAPGATRATPISGAGSTAGPGMFSYDAPRTLVRLAEGHTFPAVPVRAWSVFRLTRPQDIVVQHAPSGAAIGNAHAPVTLVAVAAAAQAAGSTSAVTALLRQAGQLGQQSPTYYGSAWIALGRLLLQTNRLRPCAA